MDEIIKLAQQIEIGNLIVWGAMLWFMQSRLSAKIEKLHTRMDTRFDQIDSRLFRWESVFINKYIIKDSRQMDKAE